eukprot:jgi/Botrbrau1/14923/Bobra.0018s0027.1
MQHSWKRPARLLKDRLLLSLWILIAGRYCYGAQHRRHLAQTASSVATVSVDTTAFRFKYPLDLPQKALRGSGACSPHSTYDYLEAGSMQVPALETTSLALRFWKATPSGEGRPHDISYFDLQSGKIVVANPSNDWATQSSSYGYTVITPTVPDKDAYLAQLNRQLKVAIGIAEGVPINADPKQGYACNAPQPAAASVEEYLKNVLAEVSRGTNMEGLPDLRPTEQRTSSGCIQEGSANYKGDIIRDIIPNVQTADGCCKLCQAQEGCNIWVWCSITAGCPTGGGDNFPFLGCHLKKQAGLSSPSDQPEAWARGADVYFTSGRVLQNS